MMRRRIAGLGRAGGKPGSHAACLALVVLISACTPAGPGASPRSVPGAAGVVGGRDPADAPTRTDAFTRTGALTRTIELRRSVSDTAVPVYPMYNHRKATRWLGSRAVRFASDGALEKNYGPKFNHAGWQFSPVAASQFCVAAHREFARSGDLKLRDHVLRQARALIARSEPAARGIVWRYHFPNSAFGARAEWISGMGQGLAIACLAAANLLSEDRRYLDAAAKAFAALRAPFGDDGTSVPVPGGVWYEEVAGRGSKPAHILNGMVFALGGLWMLHEVDPRPEYRAALDEGVAAIRSLIDDYAAPGSSLYDHVPKRLAGLGNRYNLVHVEQLQWLYGLSGDPHLLSTALRFLQLERRIPFRLKASAAGDPRRSAPRLDDGAGSYSAPAGKAVTLEIAFARPVDIDRVELVARSEATAPAAVTVIASERRARLSPPGPVHRRRVAPAGGADGSDRADPEEGIADRAPPGNLRKPGTPLAHPALLGCERLLGPRVQPAQPLRREGLDAMVHRPRRPVAALSLGDAGYELLRLTECPRAGGPVEWAFTPDLKS